MRICQQQATLLAPREPSPEVRMGDTSSHCTSRYKGGSGAPHRCQPGPEPLPWASSGAAHVALTAAACPCVLQTAEASQKLMFPNLKELISTFQKPNQGLVVPLLKPIQRNSPCLRWRRSKVELEDTYGKSRHPRGPKGTSVSLPPVRTVVLSC